jgi:fucose permease
MSLALKNGSWRSGYIYTAIIQIVIAVVIAFSIPLWSKVKPIDSQNVEEEEEISLLQMAKMRPLRVIWVVMIALNFVEYTCSAWGCTYLVEAKGMKEETAAALITFFFFGVVIGRLLSGLLSKKILTWNRIYIYTFITVLGVILLILPLPRYFTIASLFIIGLGNGPIYPNLISLTPYNFERSISSSVIGSQIASAFVGVMFAPIIYGYLKEAVGISTFVIFLSISLAVMILFLIYFVALIKKEGRYNKTV